MSKYGQPETPDEKEEIAEYWQERAEQDRKLKKEKKRARDRRSSKVYYVKSTKEAAEAKRLEWHAVRARKKAEREKQKRDAEHAPLFKALNLNEAEAQCFYKVSELISTKIVTLLASHGFLAPDKVEPALSFVLGVRH